jgi:hypothetical protein
MVLRLIGEYLEAGKHGGAVSHESLDSPLFRPVANNRTGTLDRHLDPGFIYRNIVMRYAKGTGISGEAIGFCPFDAGNGGDKRALKRGGHRQSAGMAGTR